MTQARLRQVARLEKLILPYLKRQQEQKSQITEVIRKEAFVKLANLALLILHGDPKIDEPLIAAWQRCRKSAAWRACLKRHPDFGEYGRDDYATPFLSFSAMDIAKYFRKYFLPDLPGDDEKAKLDAIFVRAPPWLLWFTHGDVYATILGVKIPDLSSVNRFARDRFGVCLPKGPFECRPLPDGVEQAAAEKYMPQLQHNMWVIAARSAVLSIITGGGKWVEIETHADPLYQHLIVTASGSSGGVSRAASLLPCSASIRRSRGSRRCGSSI